MGGSESAIAQSSPSRSRNADSPYQIGKLEDIAQNAARFTIQPERRMIQIQKQVDFIKNGENDAYGKFKVMQFRTTRRQFALIEGFTSEKSEFQTVSKEVERRLRFDHNSLVPFLSAFQSQRQEYCSEYFTIHICMEYVSTTLEEQILSKRIQKTHCSERDINSMISSVLSALIYLRRAQGIDHEWIQPRTILYDQSTRSYKITDIRFLSRGVNEFILLLNGNEIKDCCYLSPELLEALGHRQLAPQHSIEKSTVFSLGLTALRMATLSSIDSIFDFKQFAINEDQLQKLIQRVEQIYSPRFSNLLKTMLILDGSSRPDYDQLEQYISDNSSSSNNSHVNSNYNPSLQQWSASQIQQNQQTSGQKFNQSTIQEDNSNRNSRLQSTQQLSTTGHQRPPQLSNQPSIRSFTPQRSVSTYEAPTNVVSISNSLAASNTLQNVSYNRNHTPQRGQDSIYIVKNQEEAIQNSSGQVNHPRSDSRNGSQPNIHNSSNFTMQSSQPSLQRNHSTLSLTPRQPSIVDSTTVIAPRANPRITTIIASPQKVPPPRSHTSSMSTAGDSTNRIHNSIVQIVPQLVGASANGVSNPTSHQHTIQGMASPTRLSSNPSNQNIQPNYIQSNSPSQQIPTSYSYHRTLSPNRQLIPSQQQLQQYQQPLQQNVPMGINSTYHRNSSPLRTHNYLPATNGTLSQNPGTIPQLRSKSYHSSSELNLPQNQYQQPQNSQQHQQDSVTHPQIQILHRSGSKKTLENDQENNFQVQNLKQSTSQQQTPNQQAPQYPQTFQTQSPRSSQQQFSFVVDPKQQNQYQKQLPNNLLNQTSRPLPPIPAESIYNQQSQRDNSSLPSSQRQNNQQYTQQQPQILPSSSRSSLHQSQNQLPRSGSQSSHGIPSVPRSLNQNNVFHRIPSFPSNQSDPLSEINSASTSQPTNYIQEDIPKHYLSFQAEQQQQSIQLNQNQPNHLGSQDTSAFQPLSNRNPSIGSQFSLMQANSSVGSGNNDQYQQSYQSQNRDVFMEAIERKPEMRRLSPPRIAYMHPSQQQQNTNHYYQQSQLISTLTQGEIRMSPARTAYSNSKPTQNVDSARKTQPPSQALSTTNSSQKFPQKLSQQLPVPPRPLLNNSSGFNNNQNNNSLRPPNIQTQLQVPQQQDSTLNHRFGLSQSRYQNEEQLHYDNQPASSNLTRSFNANAPINQPSLSQSSSSKEYQDNIQWNRNRSSEKALPIFEENITVNQRNNLNPTNKFTNIQNPINQNAQKASYQSFNVSDIQIKPTNRQNNQQSNEIQSRLDQLSARIDKIDVSLKNSNSKPDIRNSQSHIQTSLFTTSTEPSRVA